MATSPLIFLKISWSHLNTEEDYEIYYFYLRFIYSTRKIIWLLLLASFILRPHRLPHNFLCLILNYAVYFQD